MKTLLVTRNYLNQVMVCGVATSCTVRRQLRLTLPPISRLWLPGWPGITVGAWATSLSTPCTRIVCWIEPHLLLTVHVY